MKILSIKRNENSDNKKCCGVVMSEVEIEKETFKFCSCCGKILFNCLYGNNENSAESEFEFLFDSYMEENEEVFYYYTSCGSFCDEYEDDDDGLESQVMKYFEEFFGKEGCNLKAFLHENFDRYASLKAA